MLPASGASAQLVRLLNNLVSNARDAMQDVGTLSLRTSMVYLDKPGDRGLEIPVGEYVLLEVADTGPIGAPVPHQGRPGEAARFLFDEPVVLAHALVVAHGPVRRQSAFIRARSI